MATLPNNTPSGAHATGLPAALRLSSLFTDPALRAAFARAERDDGAALVEPRRPVVPLQGGDCLVLPRSGLRLVAAAAGSLLFVGGTTR